MLRLLHFVGKGDRIVLERDGAAFAAYQKSVLAKTKIASALARSEEGGWRQERQLRSFSVRNRSRKTQPARVSFSYSFGKSGESTRSLPGATSRLPAPPTTK